MPLVLDASWALDNEKETFANLALEWIKRNAAFAPILIWFALRNTMIVGERRARLTEIRTARFLEWFGRRRIKIDEIQLFALARRHRLTTYVAAYIELASRRNAPLAALDKKLIAATLAENIALLQAP